LNQVSAIDPDSRDPGLAAERTDLAWNRSGLALLATGAVLLKGLGRPVVIDRNLAVGACTMAFGFVVAALGPWRARRRRLAGGHPATAGDLLPVSVGVSVVGVGAFLLGLISS
jgi:uncharacterized membrane protein YidH (DUF202 family)